MDNLTISNIKQIETVYRGFDLIITEIKTAENVEFWYHVKGYGIARLSYRISALDYKKLHCGRLPLDNILDYINYDELEKER